MRSNTPSVQYVSDYLFNRSEEAKNEGNEELTETHQSEVQIEENKESEEMQTVDTWNRFFERQKERQSQPESRQVVLTTENLRTNSSWGDELTEKMDNCTRLYAVNVNGFSIDRRGGQFDTTCAILKELQVDIFCAQEHNLDTTQAHLRSILFDTANQHWERNRICLGTTPITVPTSYKPGGTLVLTVGSLTGRVSKQIRDKWGRWTCQEFFGKENGQIVMFSVYQPIFKGTQVGKISVAAQQQSLLLKDSDSTTNPRTAFRRDLHQELKRYKSTGFDVLLVGDFNEPFGSDPDGMSKLAEEFGLLNLMTTRHSSKLPATYARGSKCLDYALATARIAQALRRSGYEAFNSRIQTDHRGMFFDFDTTLLFGTSTQTLQSYQRRELVASNQKLVTAYIRRKYELLLDSNAFERADRLSYLGNRHAFANRLDNDVQQASLTAEKDLPSIRAPFWSTELAQARRKVTLLTKQLSALKTKLDHRDIVSRDLQEIDPMVELPTNIHECSQQLRQHKAAVREIVKHSFERRDLERNRRIADLEQSMETADRAKAKVLRQLKKAEDLKQLFSKLKKARLQLGPRKGVTRVEIPSNPADDPKTCTSWTQVNVPTEVLRLIQERNRKHFGQAHGTPFTVPPLSELLGFCGDGEAHHQILDGSFDTSMYESNVALLLNHLQQVHDIHSDTSRPTINAEEFESKLKVWTETTTTSPSGLHLGHFKALIARHSFSTSESDDELTPEFRAQRDELNFKQSELFKLHLHLINYALERGFSYRRWQTIANTILFKDTDNVRLHRTRVIHIYEADYNLALGVKWRAAMHQAEDLHSLNEGQYGSRPCRNATDPVFIEELQCEISRATRKSVVLTNYDATACYDRIVPNLGMLVSRKHGVPLSVTQANAATLEAAEYKIRTEMGLASTGYSHTKEQPIYGTGQGSANSPAIWCFLSSVLFDCYDEKVYSATYVDTTENTKVTLGMIGFVDDCNGQTNKFMSEESPTTVPELVQMATVNAQTWTELLSVSGGALEISKTSCHVLQWNFAQNGDPVLAPKDPHHQTRLNVVDKVTDTTQSLELLSSYAAHKTLGHYKAPVGNQMEQFRQLRKKSDNITQFLWTCPLTRLEAWTYYYACYLPSVCYPLPCSSLTRKQLETIQRKAMSIIVARCGFNRNTKKEILYGPLELGGATFRHLYIQQGVGQAVLFMKKWRQDSTAGRLLRIAVSWFQQQIGMSFSFLENVHTRLPHMESKWLASLRTFLSSINSSFQLDTNYVAPLQRMYDVHIMDVLLNSKKFTPAELRRLNYCRLYLRASTISDLTHITGTRLDMSKLEGTPSLYSSVTIGTSIHQERPGVTEWGLWKKANMLWSHPCGALKESLGPWILIPSRQRQRHQAYCNRNEYDRELEIWIRMDNNEYVKCVQTIDEWHYRETGVTCTFINLPSDISPITVQVRSPGYWVMKHSGCMMIPPHPRPVATFDQLCGSLAPWEAELLANIEWFRDPHTVCEALSQGMCMVSDGSVWDNSQAAYGWTISTTQGDRCASGMGPARGSKPDSFRAEAYGMLAAVCFLSRMAEYTGFAGKWEGVLATDSESLLDVVSFKPVGDRVPSRTREARRVKPHNQLDALCAEWDLITDIVRILHNHPRVYLQHVRGHQDRKVAYAQLPLLAQLNVDADAMAARFQQIHNPAPVVLLTETAGLHLRTPQGTITSHYETALRYQATYQPLMDYMIKKNKWQSHVASWVNWKAHGSALRSNMNSRTHFVKLVQGILPTAKQVYRHNPIRRRCPKCEVAIEDWEHILKCPHEDRHIWRNKFLTELKTEGSEKRTRPLLTRVLHEGCQGWLESPSGERFQIDPELYPKEARRLICHQNDIGWHHIFLGRFAVDWSDIQDEFYARDQLPEATKRSTGHRWQVAMITFIWTQWSHLWEARNKDLHGADIRHQSEAIKRTVRRDLQDIYDARAHMEPSVQSLLHEDVTDHFTQSTWATRHWLAIHAPLVKASIKRAREKAIKGVKSIRQYFSVREEQPG